MEKFDSLIGIVVAGGQSRRMGRDKGLLTYHGIPQREHVYNLLHEKKGGSCKQVYISLNNRHNQALPDMLPAIYDLPEFRQTGPMAALLSAFSKMADSDLLVVGCDYPFLAADDLKCFLDSLTGNRVAAAFYNENQCYEPLLAWYSMDAKAGLLKCFERGEYSLQRFLAASDAQKFIPENKLAMKSVDTPDAFMETQELLSRAGRGDADHQ